MNEIQGRIHSIGDAVQATAKIKKALIIIETGDSFPQHIQFEAINTKIEKLASFFEGDHVKIKYFLAGRLWKDATGVEKCFTTLHLSDIEKC